LIALQPEGTLVSPRNWKKRLLLRVVTLMRGFDGDLRMPTKKTHSSSGNRMGASNGRTGTTRTGTTSKSTHSRASNTKNKASRSSR
jgi:hypothetical protein